MLKGEMAEQGTPATRRREQAKQLGGFRGGAHGLFWPRRLQESEGSHGSLTKNMHVCVQSVVPEHTFITQSRGFSLDVFEKHKKPKGVQKYKLRK